MALEQHWAELEGDECAQEIVAICRVLEDSDGARRKARWFECWSRYDGRHFTDERMEGRWDPDCRYNVSRSALDTAQAEIASRQRPKPMFITSGGDWQTKRRAKRTDRFVEAWLHQRHGKYVDAWDLAEDCFRDAGCDVAGVIKVIIDYERERITLKRVPAYQVLVDVAEGDDPQNWFHVYEEREREAIGKYARTGKKLKDEETKAKIRNSVRATAITTSERGAGRVNRSLKIREAWFLPPSEDEPGKHVVACDGGVLLEENWTWPTPPLAIYVWSREAFGIWGLGMVQAAAAQHDKIQELAFNVDERFRLCAQQKTYFVPGNQVEGDTGLQSNDTHVLIPVRDMAQAPRDVVTPPITPAETQHLDSEIQKYFDIATGISQTNASSRKEAGVDSGIALQTLNDQKSVRFLPKARSYEMLFVQLGELIVRAARDLAEKNGGKLVARWPGAKYFEEVDWSEASLEENMYTVRVAPVSSMSRDPAQRLQIVEQLAGLGFLPKEKYFELIGMPDLDTVFEQESAESRWTEKLVDRYLDAANEADLKKRGGFVEPDGYLMNPMGALASVAQHYFDAMVNEAPVFNTDLMRRFMRSLQRIIEATMKPEQQPAAAPAAEAAEAAALGAMPVGPGQAPMSAAA